jgi:hypothetical protein
MISVQNTERQSLGMFALGSNAVLQSLVVN